MKRVGIPVIGLALFVSAGAASAQDAATGFEFFDFDGFMIGTAPHRVSFTDGNSKTVGRFSFYHTGSFSWMIRDRSTGTIAFETPAAEVVFWARHSSGSLTDAITVIGTDDSVLARVDLTTQWTQIRMIGLDPIAEITVTNTGPAGSYSLVDDFSFTAIPEPDPVPGDFDGDGDADLADLLTLVSCFSGPAAAHPPGCAAADADGDGDVDLADVVAFQAAFTGSL